MSMNAPSQLVDAFKRSGEFDRLRKELLAEFQNGDNIENFTKRIQDIVRQRLEGDQKLQQLAPEAMQRELTQEVDRYPVVERARDEVMSSHSGLSDSIRASARRILRGENPRDLSRSASPNKPLTNHNHDGIHTDSPAHTPRPPSVNGILNQTDVTMDHREMNSVVTSQADPSSQTDSRPVSSITEPGPTVTPMEINQLESSSAPAALPSEDTTGDVKMQDSSLPEHSPVFYATQPEQHTSMKIVSAIDTVLPSVVEDSKSERALSTPEGVVKQEADGEQTLRDSAELVSETTAVQDSRNSNEVLAAVPSPPQPQDQAPNTKEEPLEHFADTLDSAIHKAEDTTEIPTVSEELDSVSLPTIQSATHAEALADTGDQAQTDPVPHALIQAGEPSTQSNVVVESQQPPLPEADSTAATETL